MHIIEEKRIYQNEERYIDIKQELRDSIQFSLLVEIQSDKFLEYQKDLIEEFVGNFIETIQNAEDVYDDDAVRINCENSLQELNTKLKEFADKVRDVDFFPDRKSVV